MDETSKQRANREPRSWGRRAGGPARPARLRLLGLGMVLVALASTMTMAFANFGAPAANADTHVPDNNADPYFTLTVNAPTTDLIDGQSLPFTVDRTAQGTAAGLQIAAVGTGWCQPTVDLALNNPPALPWSESSLNQEYQSAGLTGFPIVSSQGVGVLPCLSTVNGDITANLPAITPAQNGSGDYPTVNGNAFVEAGDVTGPPGPLQNLSVACDANDPCLFAVAIWTRDNQGNNNIFFAGVPVSYQPSIDNACNGADPNELSIASPDRLGPTVTSWLIAACKDNVDGGKALATDVSSGNSDQQTLCDFASGGDDMVFSAVGYGSATSDFNPTRGATGSAGANCAGGPQPDRSYIPIPVALNSVVLSHSQDQVVDPAFQGFGHTLEPYSQQLDITIDQLAQLLANGGTVDAGGTVDNNGGGDWGGSLGSALLSENPQLSNGLRPTGPGVALTAGTVATSGSDATTWFATNFLSTLAPTYLWSQVQAVGNGGQIPPGQLGPITNFGTEDNPPYNIVPATGASILAKDITPISGSYWWALTNGVTSAATWGGLANFAVQAPDSLDGAPVWVAPTTQTMQAAVNQMIPQADGTLLPNPNTTEQGGIEPYPLTFVEYAIVPAQPLLNPDCSVNVGAETNLVNLIGYLIGGGQSHLPAGMAPLTPGLQLDALLGLLSIGSAPPSCTSTTAPTTTTTSPTTTTTTTASSGSGSSGSSPPGSSASSGSSAASGGSSFSSSPSSFSSTGLPATASSVGSTGSGTGNGTGKSSGSGSGAPASTRTPIPTELAAFKKVVPAGWVLPAIGVIIMALLLPGLILLASGKSFGELFGGRGGGTP